MDPLQTMPGQTTPSVPPIDSLNPVPPAPADMNPQTAPTVPPTNPAAATPLTSTEIPLSTLPQTFGAQSPFANNPAGTPPPAMPSHPMLEEEHSGMPIFIKIAAVLLVVFAVIALVLFLFSMRKASSDTQKVTLTYWGLWEDKSVMANVLNDFTKQHPNITVDYIQQDPKQYTERLITRIQGGNGPDVFRFHNTWLPFLQPLMTPLSKETISPQDFNTNYYPVIRSDLSKNGAIYGVPLEIDTLAMFVNTDLLKKAGVSVPTTWNDFVTDARTLTVVDANGKIQTAGAAIGTYDNVTHAPDILSMLFVQSGVNPINFSQNAQNAGDALSFYTSFALGKTAVWDSSQEQAWSMFAKGKVAIYFGYSWDVFQIKAVNPTLPFAVYPVPHLPGSKATIASYWAEGISNKSTHQQEAQLLLAYLSKKETLQKLYTEESKVRLFGEPYPRIDLASTVKDNPYIAPFLAAAPDAVSSYFVGNTYDSAVNIPLDNYLGDAVRSVLSNTSAQTAITTLSQGTAQVLSRYGIK